MKDIFIIVIKEEEKKKHTENKCFDNGEYMC